MKTIMKGVNNYSVLPLFILILSLSINSFARDSFKLSEKQAKEEVRIVVENLLKHHPNPFHISSKDVFYKNVSQLQKRKGDITLTRQYFDLSHLLSLVFDVHTQLHITDETRGFKTTFPLRFRIFPDGLYIIAGSQNYQKGIGKKVVSISGTPVAEVIDKISQFPSADSLIRKRVSTEMFLYLPETYDYFNLITPLGKIELVLQDLNGKRSNLELSKTWDKGLADFSWDSLNPFIPKEFLSVHDVMGTKKPFYLRNLTNNYWYGFIDEPEKYMYLQINFPFKKTGGQLPTDFHLNWSRDLWKSKAEVLIIDLRNDPGGSISLGNPIPGILSTLFHEHPTLRGVAVLMGTDTVSAGVILVAQLEDAIAPVIIGSPSGSSPNMFLQATKIDLPYSKIRFEVSTDKYIITRELDTRRYIAPDIPMALSFDDYANGRDPLIEFAKTIDKKMRKDIYGTASVYQPWFRDTQIRKFGRGVSKQDK
jgi:hypothetical protein